LVTLTKRRQLAQTAGIFPHIEQQRPVKVGAGEKNIAAAL
jgi:hypothetical protein